MIRSANKKVYLIGLHNQYDNDVIQFSLIIPILKFKKLIYLRPVTIDRKELNGKECFFDFKGQRDRRSSSQNRCGIVIAMNCIGAEGDLLFRTILVRITTRCLQPRRH